ncbi:MAG: beta-lactamase family protein [Candidatus Aminicenantes bacterium]|nr:MAG: beta-lactamase family protein [Candidatus Aminicenantes bacterium]
MRQSHWFIRISIVILLLGKCLCNSFAQSLQPASPEEVGLSSFRLKRIQKIIQNHIEKGELAGTVTLIARHGKIVQHEAFGQMSIEEGIPMTRDAIFRIASMTKVFTSIAVMILYEEGRFSLHDPISKYIPQFKDMKVVIWPNNKPQDIPLITEPSKRPIIIRDLLRHTAGFSYGHGFYDLDKMYKEAGMNPRSLTPWQGTLNEFVESISKLPLVHHPGTIWVYSYATDILGYLIEIIASEPLDKFLEKRVFRPLGLKDTYFIIPQSKLNRFPNLYKYANGDLELVESAASSNFRNMPSALSGGGGWTSTGYGGIVTTALDFTKMLQLFLNGGILDGQRLLSRKTVELMMRNHLPGIQSDMLGPGVNFGLMSAVLTSPGKYGELGTKGQVWWAGSCNTYFFVDPKEEMIGVLMTQIHPFGHLGLMGKFKRLCMQMIVD